MEMKIMMSVSIVQVIIKCKLYERCEYCTRYLESFNITRQMSIFGHKP